MQTSSIPVFIPAAELNRETVAELRAVIDPLIAQGPVGPGLVLDLGGVTFINSTALGYVVSVGKELAEQGRRIALARPQRSVEKLLRIVGLNSMLPHFRSVPEAQRHVGAASLRA